MKGADDYYDLFNGKSQLIGRLFIQCHQHGRGKCFEIFVLPEGGELTQHGHAPSNSVCVYGVTGGQRGWDETYGWLHRGRWQDDFQELVNARRTERQRRKAKDRAEKEQAILLEKQKTQALLDSY